MCGWGLAITILLTASVSVIAGVIIGAHLERAGRDIADALDERKWKDQ